MLDGIANQSAVPDEVIIVHSGEVKFDHNLIKMFPEFKFLCVKERLFAGAARNLGAKNASGAFLAFIDNDCVPDEDWLKCLIQSVEAFDASITLGAVGYTETGGYWGLVRWLLELSAIAPFGDSKQVIGHGGSGNMLVKQEVFHAVGGFDESYRMGQDKKFFLEVIQQFGPAFFCSQAIVRHSNTKGFKSNIFHCKELGFWSAQVEKQVGYVAGQWRTRVATTPAFFVFVGGWRLLRISLRILSWPLNKMIRHIGLLPGVGIALLFWSWGFLHGCKAPLPNVKPS